MVGAAREEEEVAPLPQGKVIVVPNCAAILPRRILFHPPLKAPLPTSSSLSLTLTPLNLPPPLLSSSTAVLEDPSYHKTSLRASTPLPTIRIQQIGAGLNNLGNTCFLNAVLQCLTYTPPLAAYFQAGRHHSSCRSVGFCAMCALESHVKQALSARGRVISPNLLVKNLRCISRSFQMGRQEDAHEYMRYLIEALQKSCLLEAHANTSSSSHQNFIQRIFGGRLRSQVKCTQCSQSSNTYDPFLDLSLDIVKAESLLKALARFTAIEVLDGNNKYHCCKCKAKVRAHKQFTIDNAPHVLTVQFKRFSSTGGYGGKIDKQVQFDRSFNLTPFVNGGKGGGLRYSLYAVLVHAGWSTHSGHYFCFVRTATDIWHKLDDNRVSQVSEKIVLEQKAYILFYVRDTDVLQTPNGKDHGIQAPNGKDHGIRSERFSILNGTSDVVKKTANGTSNHQDAAQLKGKLHMSRNNDNHATRSCLNIVTNDMCNNIQGMPNKVEVLPNGNMVRASTISTTRACSPGPAAVIGKDPAKGKHDGDILNKINGDSNEPSTSSQAKECILSSAETKSHLCNGMQVPENSCLTEQKRSSAISRHEMSGNGSVKRVCMTSVKEAVRKEDMLQRLERQGALLDGSTLKVLSSTEKEMDDKKLIAPVSSHALPLSYQMAVPRWEDDAEASQGNTYKEHNVMAETVAHCGHVLDEWDEEYDRGKRKKLRRRKGVMEEISEVSECLHTGKKRKVCSSPQEHSSTAAHTSNEDCHGNVFQVFSGKKVKSGAGAARLKKSRKRQRGLGHKLFLKRHRFKQLHTNRQHKRKR